VARATGRALLSAAPTFTCCWPSCWRPDGPLASAARASSSMVDTPHCTPPGSTSTLGTRSAAAGVPPSARRQKRRRWGRGRRRRRPGSLLSLLPTTPTRYGCEEPGPRRNENLIPPLRGGKRLGRRRSHRIGLFQLTLTFQKPGWSSFDQCIPGSLLVGARWVVPDIWARPDRYWSSTCI
jgi:hypothetical protein